MGGYFFWNDDIWTFMATYALYFSSLRITWLCLCPFWKYLLLEPLACSGGCCLSLQYRARAYARLLASSAVIRLALCSLVAALEGRADKTGRRGIPVPWLRHAACSGVCGARTQARRACAFLGR